MDLWLPDVRIAKMAPRLIDSTGRFVSPLNGAVRTITRPGDRWGFRIDYGSLHDVDRARIEAFMAAQRGAANRVLIAPQDYVPRGTFPLGELLPIFSTSTWAASGADFTVTDRVARIANNTSSIFGRISPPLMTLAVGYVYIVRVIAMPGNQTNWHYYAGTTPGAGDIFIVTPSALDQISTVAFAATSANFYFTLATNSTVLGDSIYYTYASVTRGALVNGANQSGSGLNIDGLPASGNGLLVPGDWIGIGAELKRVTAALSSNSSGQGYLQFSPPLRASPADNSPIVVTDPLGRFIISGNTTGWETEPGKFATSSMDFVEAS